MVPPQFDLARLGTTIIEAVASGLTAIDRYPVEVLPGYWVITGVIPYGGHVALAVVDFNSPEPSHDRATPLTLSKRLPKIR